MTPPIRRPRRPLAHLAALAALALVLALGAPAVHAQAPVAPAPPPDARALGRTATQQFYAGEIDPLWERFGQAMKDALKSKDRLRAFRDQVAAQAGAESEVIEEVGSRQGDFAVYVRTARFAKAPMPLIVQWTFNAKGEVEGFFVQPQQAEAPSRYLDYTTKTPLRLPFEGEWTVFWGGRKVAENYHAITRDQRFAYDILIFRDGVSHTGDGRRNDQYFAFGQPILAPGDGTVAVAVDGLEDNAPGVMDREHPPGNHVILDHGNGEYSLLAHLQKGSVRVKKGDAVKAGAPLGLCGNSGNTSEPHLHYHLQTAGEFGQGDGLPTQFLHYSANGTRTERGEPTKGQVVKNAPAEAPKP